MVRVDDIFKLKQRKEAKEQAQIQLQEQTKNELKKEFVFLFHLIHGTLYFIQAISYHRLSSSPFCA